MNALCQQINSLHPGAADRLDRIDQLPNSASRMIVNILLGRACQAQNVGNITSARTLLRTLPPLWLSSILPDAIEAVLDLNDEWAYRRLIELLEELKSELRARYLEHGMASSLTEIREAATDMSN